MIQTVLGPVDPALVRRVDFHEHLLADSSGLQRPGVESTPLDERVTLENLGYLRWNCLGLADNLRLDSIEDAVEELSDVSFDLVVEASSLGLGPRHADYPSLASSLNIVVAYGTYIGRVLPAEVLDLDLEKHFREALTVAVPGTSYKAGLLGIMGTTGDVPEVERARLRAAARAASAVSACVTIRLDPDFRAGLPVLEEMVKAGQPADRVVFTNADEYPDRAYWAELSDAGAVLEFCFGTDFQHVGRVRNLSDMERLDHLEAFLTDRPQARVVLGGSLWTKAQLKKYGGQGYDHVFRRIVPELARRGVPSEALERMTHDEPLRQLTRS